MSTATADKEKPASPLGSFVAKLQSPAKPKEEKVEAKAEEPKVVPEKPAETKGEAKAEPAPEPKKEEPKEDAAILEKRLKDTQSWGNEEHKARLKAERDAKELKDRLDRIEQKLDGTYEEPASPSPDQLAYDAEMRGKIRASHRAAVKQYGEEFVMTQVWNPDSPYMTLQASNPLVAQRVLNSDDPVAEALAVLKEEEDAKKYGRTSEEMRKKIEEEMKPKITKEILEGLKTQPGPPTRTLGHVRGEADRTSQKSEAPASLDFKRVFPHGASRA